jgi:probable blue pigment (indigoidine) exporter
LLPIALITEGTFNELTRTNLWGFIYLALVGTALAYALWFRGINILSPTAVSYLGLLSPLVATLIGYVFLQETLTAIQLIGVATVLVSIVMGQQFNVPQNKKTSPASSSVKSTRKV